MRKFLLITLTLFFTSLITFAQSDFSESAPYKPDDVPPIKKIQKKEKKSSKKNEVSPSTENTQAVIDGNKLASVTETQRIAVTVSDTAGNSVENLQKTDFKVYVDEVEQEITGFGTSDEPLNVILVVDVSPSAAFGIEAIRNYANALVSQLKPQDKVLVMSFGEKASALTALTTDRREISKAIKKLEFIDGTSIYETVEFSFQKHFNSINGRKTIILITDGVDTTSRKAGFEDSLFEAEKNDAAFYIVYVDTTKYLSQPRQYTLNLPGLRGKPAPIITMPAEDMSSDQLKELKENYENGRRYLTNLAALSGGQIVNADIAKPQSTGFENIFESIRNQFYLRFTPSEKGIKDQRRLIRVRVSRPNLLVRARGSYIVGATAQAAK